MSSRDNPILESLRVMGYPYDREARWFLLEGVLLEISNGIWDEVTNLEQQALAYKVCIRLYDLERDNDI